MSISDKLITIAENQEKVYKAGQSSMVDESKIIKKTVSGEYISVDDVSEIPHEVKVKLTSGNGKNLFNINSNEIIKGQRIAVKTGGVYPNSEYNVSHYIPVEGGKIYAITTSGFYIYYSFYDENYTYITGTGTSTIRIVTTPQNACYFRFDYPNTDTEVQFEQNDTITPYEPYKETLTDYSNVAVSIGTNESETTQIIKANADGTVEGAKSLSPYMRISTDNYNATINAEYHKSYGIQTEYDRFWDTHWINRPKDNFNNAFGGMGWNDENFEPPENTTIVVLNANMMFRRSYIVDLAGILKKRNITMDFSQSTYSQQLLSECSELKSAPVISFLSCASLQEVCYNCQSLERIGFILKDDGTNLFGSTFYNCKALIDITFEGVIGNNINFQYSSLLSKASILNIFEHLSSTVTGQTLTLSKTAVTNAFGSTTATEWTNLVATKTNWTISLV